MNAIQWTPKDLGRQVSLRRQARGLTQVELGALCGTPGNTIARIERGEQTPRSDLLRALAIALDVTADLLLGLGD